MRRAIALLVLAGVALAAWAGGLQDAISLETLRDNRQSLLAWRGANPLAAVAGFVVIYTVIVAVSLPGAAVMTLAGGFLFGPWLGGAMTVVGATLGAALVFLAARTAMGDRSRRRAGTVLARMEDGFRRDAFNYLLFLRLVPLFPFWAVNLVPALLGMRPVPYVLATAIGIVPGTFAYAAFGAGLGEAFDAGAEVSMAAVFNPTLLTALAGLALLSLAPVAWRRRRR